MTTILHLNSTASGADSVTAKLSAQLVETISGPDTTVVTRDLTTLPVLTGDHFAANNTPTGDRTPAQAELAAAADAAIADLEGADVVVISAPVYNFGVPSAVKAWMDLVARAGTTFRYTANGPEGLLSGKKAYIVSASGGVPLGSEVDFATPHTRTFLNFIGIDDVTLIGAGSLMQDPSSLENAENLIRELVAA
jgi:FMN-dependent NADH-azoreductase